MGQNSTIQETIAFAELVLTGVNLPEFNESRLLQKEITRVRHDHNYFSKKISRNSKIQETPGINDGVIFTAPGQARPVEMKLPPRDPRAGVYPQHNSPGLFRVDLEVIPSLALDAYKNIHTVDCLIEAGFVPKIARLTKKHLEKIQEQFANLSSRCFRDMMCLFEENKRDFEVWVKIPDNHQEWLELNGKRIPINCDINVAYINSRLELVQFIQCSKYNQEGQLIDLKHVVFETGLPLVINQSCFDKFGNLRNIAHVGVTGSAVNGFHNSLERFDDGTVIWTSSNLKDNQFITGSAALKLNGEVLLLNASDKVMAEFSARNLGAEGINPKTLAWTEKFSPDACIAETNDRFIVRREYKQAVRKQSYQIVDGACIPGPEPIFDLIRLL